MGPLNFWTRWVISPTITFVVGESTSPHSTKYFLSASSSFCQTPLGIVESPIIVSTCLSHLTKDLQFSTPSYPLPQFGKLSLQLICCFTTSLLEPFNDTSTKNHHSCVFIPTTHLLLCLVGIMYPIASTKAIGTKCAWLMFFTQLLHDQMNFL